MENLKISELKENIIKSYKAGRSSSAELWYRRYREAGGKSTYRQIVGAKK